MNINGFLGVKDFRVAICEESNFIGIVGYATIPTQ